MSCVRVKWNQCKNPIPITFNTSFYLCEKLFKHNLVGMRGVYLVWLRSSNTMDLIFSFFFLHLHMRILFTAKAWLDGWVCYICILTPEALYSVTIRVTTFFMVFSLYRFSLSYSTSMFLITFSVLLSYQALAITLSLEPKKRKTIVLRSAFLQKIAASTFLPGNKSLLR